MYISSLSIGLFIGPRPLGAMYRLKYFTLTYLFYSIITVIVVIIIIIVVVVVVIITTIYSFEKKVRQINLRNNIRQQERQLRDS